jgi:hypothetical protein
MSQTDSPPDNQSDTTDGAMSFGEFCRWANIGKTKAYAEAKAGRLELRKIGTKTIVFRAEGERYLRSLPTIASLGERA